MKDMISDPEIGPEPFILQATSMLLILERGGLPGL
jgi:hypothetical protein